MKSGGPLRRYKALVSKTQLRSKQGLKSGGPIKPKPPTEKQREDREAFEAGKRIIWKRAGGQCEVFYTGILVSSAFIPGNWHRGQCTHEAHDAHHISRQSQGHDHSPENLLAVCRYHHRWIHDHVAEARKLGYLSPAKRGDL